MREVGSLGTCSEGTGAPPRRITCATPEGMTLDPAVTLMDRLLVCLALAIPVSLLVDVVDGGIEDAGSHAAMGAIGVLLLAVLTALSNRGLSDRLDRAPDAPADSEVRAWPVPRMVAVFALAIAAPLLADSTSVLVAVLYAGLAVSFALQRSSYRRRERGGGTVLVRGREVYVGDQPGH